MDGSGRRPRLNRAALGTVVATALATGMVLGLTPGQASALGSLAGTTRGLPTTVEQVPAPLIPKPVTVQPGTVQPAKVQPAGAQPAKVRTVKPRPRPKPAAVRKPPARRPAALPTTLRVAQSEVGGPEARYTTGWSFEPGFWCAKFVSWVLAHSGVSVRADGPADLARLVLPVATPRPGDLVFIDLVPQIAGAGITHVAVVESVEADGSVHTIEGNGDNSHTVIRGVRRGAEIIGFGRPPAPTSKTVIPAPPAPLADCDWVALGKPWMCD